MSGAGRSTLGAFGTRDAFCVKLAPAKMVVGFE